ncbi:carbohydrate ABC transporter permease [Gynuella sunshinyii]|uniref:ABC-type sugar transport system, permease component n=1 Tax=Gynuella sunshinyii YC6258 TaxID=1445510 RepID=A0A0C5VGI8_9GAMM|nr:sugar ABC transporter permease [Gynuella sunshinyii]AJQ93291.1 ABC-type sugar transport system, permease component [Gynuella sunshinyii YC6258]
MARQQTTPMNRFMNVNGWAFVSVSLVLIALFSIYPVIKSLWLSTQVGMGVVTHFGGFSNIVRLANDPLFLTALKNTFIFLIVQVPIMIMLALVLANALNNPNLKFRGILRTAIFLPCVTSLVAYSVLFKSMFSYNGLINSFLLAIHVISDPIPWLTDPFWAKVTIIIAITWRWTGYNMIFYLAALQNIDRSIYEAADLEGASARHKFFKITIPMLKPVILFTTITSTIGTLQLFDEVMNITVGGPANATITLSMYIYNLSFKFVPNFGYAATVSYVIVLIVALLSVLQFKVVGREK